MCTYAYDFNLCDFEYKFINPNLIAGNSYMKNEFND